ncbi:MAG TPA: four helix bundle protein [Haliangiales bacterium]|nr:four helix bundle protein [Haliangiales bacterium]
MPDTRYSVTALNRYNDKNSGAQPGKATSFQTFEDLEAYQVAREFRKAMYGVSRRLPDFEKFELASQIRRAAVSLTNNIAEGHGRYHYPDQIKFLLQARGSLEELIDDLNVCLDENYLPAAEIETLKSLGWRTLNVINGYGRFLRQKKTGKASALHEGEAAAGFDENDDPFAEAPL